MQKKYKLISGLMLFFGIGCLGLFWLFGKVTYEVAFDSDGGSVVETQMVNNNEHVIKPTDPIKEGFQFAGWTLDGDIYDFNNLVTTNFTLKASWKEVYKVSVTLDDEVYTHDYFLGDKVNLLDFDFPSKEGYKVVLLVQDEEESKEFNLETEIIEPLSFVGEYRELKKVIVTFDSDGGSTVDSLNVLEGTIIEEPKVTKEKCTFLGWFKGDKKYDFKQPVTDDMTLVASWKDGNKVSVNFYVDDKKYDTILVPIGGKVNKPVDPEKEGFIFEGWKHNSKMFDFDTILEKDLTLTANFRVAKTFKVTFNSNGGTDVKAQSILENGKVSKPINPTRVGYRFAEWTYENMTYDFEKPVNQHMTLKAKWEKEDGFVVSFDSNGGTSVASQFVGRNQLAQKPDDPTKNNAVFVGWQLNGVDYDFSSPVTTDITLKAIWTDA